MTYLIVAHSVNDLHDFRLIYKITYYRECVNKYLMDETESNIQFIASRQGNIGRNEAEPNIILYGRSQLDVGRGQVQ